MPTRVLNTIKKENRDGCRHIKSVNIGDRLGKLVVEQQAEDYIEPCGTHRRQWKCRCDCGREKVVQEHNLKRGLTTSCGLCGNRVSMPEKAILYYMRKCFSEVKENYRPRFLNGEEIDVYIPKLKVGIEYDGERWHQDFQKDWLKSQTCINHGITLIRIREQKCPMSEKFQHVIITSKPTSNATHMTKPIRNLIIILNEYFSANIRCDVDCLRDNPEIAKTLISSEKFKSLASERPDLLSEWDYQKNSPLKPDRIAEHSGRKVWWICPKGHSYSMSPASRTSKKDPRGCPICGKEKCVITNHQNRITKHNLAKDFPDIADEWDYTRNKIMPSEVSPHSHQKVWWKCKKCGHIWQSTISSRTGKTKNGCPCCNGGIAKRIGCFDKEENLIMFFDSARQAANKFDVEPSFVCSCCRNEKWALGYHWKYIVNS